MSYALAVESLLARGHELVSAPGAPRRKFDLAQMRALAAALGSPERAFKSVLIAGTNGKGSTAATLASILEATGYRTGLYTSPHLTRVNERIQIDRAAISDDDFARLYFRVDEAGERLVRDGALPQHPSFFEAMTALAFLYFAEQHVDLAVLEVGIGGRLDATNIVEPLLSVVTDISLDHMEWLGSTVAEIAREKAGILRPNGTLVTLPQHPEANRVLGETALSLGATGINAAEYMPPLDAPVWNAKYPVTIFGEQVELAPPLAGNHQHRNVALAVAAAIELSNRHGYKLRPEHFAAGVRDTRWPGRLEKFPATADRPEILLDVAHNPAGAWTLRSALEHLPAGGATTGPRTLIFGCMRDKAVAEMAQILFPVFDRIFVTPVDSPRSAPVEELLAAAQAVGATASAAASPVEALQQAFALAKPDNSDSPDSLIVGSGSVYLVGSLRAFLLRAASVSSKAAGLSSTTK